MKKVSLSFFGGVYSPRGADSPSIVRDIFGGYSLVVPEQNFIIKTLEVSINKKPVKLSGFYQKIPLKKGDVVELEGAGTPLSLVIG